MAETYAKVEAEKCNPEKLIEYHLKSRTFMTTETNLSNDTGGLGSYNLQDSWKNCEYFN